MDKFLKIKKQFPIFNNQKGLVYLDNAATTQKPQVVLDAGQDFYERFNSNIHRGIYGLSELATEKYEQARWKTAKFIKAADAQEIIFTKNATEAINLVAYTWGEKNIRAGDEILVSVAEHHSNFVPWQQLAWRKRAVLKIISVDNNGFVTKENMIKQLSDKTKLLAICHVSNALGTVMPLKEIIGAAKKSGVRVLIDAAQSVVHLPINVCKLDCDWLAFSGHKMYGPTGIGVLYGKKELFMDMPPFMFGGGMIKEVRLEETDWADLPQKFEGGTPPIAEAVALGAAIDFIEKLGFDGIEKYEDDLLSYGLSKLSAMKEVIIYGPKNCRNCKGIISFNLKNIHSHDVATLVNDKDVALRAGYHCAQPLMRALGTSATCRISFSVYNSREDIDRLIVALEYALSVLK